MAYMLKFWPRHQVVLGAPWVTPWVTPMQWVGRADPYITVRRGAFQHPEDPRSDDEPLWEQCATGRRNGWTGLAWLCFWCILVHLAQLDSQTSDGEQ